MKLATVFVVADDELVLASLRGLFLLEGDYEVDTFSDARKALEALAGKEVAVIISDFLMPGMNGIEFLKEAKQTQPETPRILLTGFADKENAIRGINEAGLFQYLEKPWDNSQLLMTVKNALEQRSLRRRLEEKVHEYGQLLIAHADLAKRHDTLESELEMAARVIRGLMPQKWPTRSRWRFDSLYRPSQIIGGDFYDFAGGDRRMVLMLADVSGHGVQAALSATLLRAIFQEMAIRAENPVGLLKTMNERLHVYMPSGMFAAAMLVWGDGDRWSVASAGLPPPVVMRRGQRRVDEIAIHGLPLGLLPEAPVDCFDSREVHLEAGDTLLASTDGLVEVRGSSGQLFVEDGLRNAYREVLDYPAAVMMDALVRRAVEFGSIVDDVSMIGLTATGD
jgi:serine phosphatase RsbU (regulator of sigma subunit)